MDYKKPNLALYRIAQAACFAVSKLFFGCRIRRNELRKVKGPCVIICNHECALDFVNIIRLSRSPLSFVISYTFYNTLPIRPYLKKLAVLPKQQFQSKLSDLRKMKSVLEAGHRLAIFPAGLMGEDGLSTPIPDATYKFLKWLGSDVYVARSYGAYFCMPKWGKGLRRGRTELDCYKLIGREELGSLTLEEIRRRTDHALLYDAYREPRGCCRAHTDIRGLENVLYLCPACGGEFTVTADGRDTLRCSACGFAERSDRSALLHKIAGPGEEIPYVSDWSRMINDKVRRDFADGSFRSLESPVTVSLLDLRKKKFFPAGQGTLSLSESGFVYDGSLNGEAASFSVPLTHFPTLPFIPGRYFEIQQNDTVYRIQPDDIRLSIRFVQLVECIFEAQKQS